MKNTNIKLSQIVTDIGDLFLHPITLSNISGEDQPLIYVNKPFRDLTQFENEEIIGKNCRFLQGPLSDKAAVQRIKDAISVRAPICQDLINYKSNGEMFYNRLVLIPFKEADETYYIGLQHEIDEKSFKPIHVLDRLMLEDKALNPLTVLVSLLMTPTPVLEKNLSDTMIRIRDFVLSL